VTISATLHAAASFHRANALQAHGAASASRIRRAATYARNAAPGWRSHGRHGLFSHLHSYTLLFPRSHAWFLPPPHLLFRWIVARLRATTRLDWNVTVVTIFVCVAVTTLCCVLFAVLHFTLHTVMMLHFDYVATHTYCTTPLYILIHSIPI